MTDSPISVGEAVNRLGSSGRLTDVHDTEYQGVYWLTFDVGTEEIALMVEVGDARTNGEKSPETDLILGEEVRRGEPK